MKKIVLFIVITMVTSPPVIGGIKLCHGSGFAPSSEAKKQLNDNFGNIKIRGIYGAWSLTVWQS